MFEMVWASSFWAEHVLHLEKVFGISFTLTHLLPYNVEYDAGKGPNWTQVGENCFKNSTKSDGKKYVCQNSTVYWFKGVWTTYSRFLRSWSLTMRVQLALKLRPANAVLEKTRSKKDITVYSIGISPARANWMIITGVSACLAWSWLAGRRRAQ